MARPLSARDKLIAAGMSWFLFGGLTGYLAVKVHPAFLLATLLLMLGLSAYTFTIVCMKCATPLIQRSMKLGKTSVVYYTIPDSDVCSKCGEHVT